LIFQKEKKNAILEGDLQFCKPYFLSRPMATRHLALKEKYIADEGLSKGD
jgi:hypothetical protein